MARKKSETLRAVAKKQSLDKRLQVCKANLAKVRDDLRDLQCEVDEIYESCDSGLQELEAAVATLSQYV